MTTKCARVRWGTARSVGAALFAGTEAGAFGPPVHAQEVKLPSAVTMTAYDTGTSGFNISVAVGKMLKEKPGWRRARPHWRNQAWT